MSVYQHGSRWSFGSLECVTLGFTCECGQGYALLVPADKVEEPGEMFLCLQCGRFVEVSAIARD